MFTEEKHDSDVNHNEAEKIKIIDLVTDDPKNDSKNT